MKQERNETKTKTQFTLRIESNLYELIKESANKYKRSIAKEIEFAIEKYLENQN